MPPIPANKLTELALSRRKLFEKIVQHVATRKIQNAIQATGDRMMTTPQQFGMQIGQQSKRSAFNGAALGRAAGRAVDTASSYLGQQMRGAGIQAGRAMNRLSTAAKPLMNEAQEIGTTVSNKMDKALMGTPARAAMTGAAAGAAGAGLHMAGHQPAVQQMAPHMPMPRMQQQLLGGTSQGGVAGSNDPYSMKVSAILPAMGIGAGLGAVTSPAGHRMEGAGRGAAKGTGTGLGAVVGTPVGALGALALSVANPRLGKALFSPSKHQLANYLRQMFRGGKAPRVIRAGGPGVAIDKKLQLVNTLVGGGTAGALGGGAAGYAGTSAALGAPSWEKKEASVLSVLGGLTGGGLGGLAGGAGGGILGALGGGALGGGPGAGLGLLAGGAAGLGAGAHMGGNIGANIGASFSKKKDEKPESEEKSEEKGEEKAEDSGDEEVKKSAAAVLAQLRKNAGDTVGFLHPHAHDFRKDTPAPRPMTGAAGTMKRVGDQMAQTSPLVAGVLPQLAGKNIAAAAPAVQAAGNKLTAGGKNMRPAATGGVNMFGAMPAMAGNLGRFLGGR